MTEAEIRELIKAEAREYARSTEFRATMLDAQRTLFRAPRLRTAAEFAKFAETATDQTIVELANGQSGWWTFVYDAAITDAYKWVFMGGDTLVNKVEASTTSLSATYGVGGGTAPAVVAVPFSGKYVAWYSAQMDFSTNNTLATISPYFGSTAAVEADAAVHRTQTLAVTGIATVASETEGTLTSPGSIGIHVRSNGVDVVSFYRTKLVVLPRRIGP